MLERDAADMRDRVEAEVPGVGAVGALLEGGRRLGGEPLVFEELPHGHLFGSHPGAVLEGAERLDARRLGVLARAEPAFADLAARAVATGDVDVVGPGRAAPADVATAGSHRASDG